MVGWWVLQGTDVTDEELLEYISESSTMSKAMDEYEGACINLLPVKGEIVSVLLLSEMLIAVGQTSACHLVCMRPVTFCEKHQTCIASPGMDAIQPLKFPEAPNSRPQETTATAA